MGYEQRNDPRNGLHDGLVVQGPEGAMMTFTLAKLGRGRWEVSGAGLVTTEHPSRKAAFVHLYSLGLSAFWLVTL